MELLAACQAFFYGVIIWCTYLQGMEFLKPLKSTDTLQKVYNLVRTVAPFVFTSISNKKIKNSSALDQDRYMHPEIQSVIGLVRSNRIWEVVEPHLTRMSEMESSRPDLLRQEAESPTAAVLGLPDFTRVLWIIGKFYFILLFKFFLYKICAFPFNTLFISMHINQFCQINSLNFLC